jgi:succinate-semialdehyde dehydrogenase/glutarate-semialdehyde dehydrogenase
MISIQSDKAPSARNGAHTSQPMESINPATGETVATFPTMDRDTVDAIIGAAAVAQKEWAQVPMAERTRLMRQAGKLLRERARELARLATVEMGKPIKDGVAEVNKCAWVCEHYADEAERYLAPREEKTDGSRSYVRFDPLGVVLAVMPWNFPYWQVFRFIAPALTAGNGGLLKHASNVPQCALAIEKVMRDAGFPANLFRTLLVGSREVARIIADQRVAAATLTGSELAGRAVAEAAGRALKPVVLELGGSDPFIVLADADVNRAAEVAAQARTINAGQSCICAKRFIVAAPVYDAFLEKLTAAMKKVRMGDPMDESVDIGPQARADLRDELHDQVRKAISQGARLVMGGSVPPGPGAFYPPTILADVRAGNLAYEEEIFGPVATVIKARDAADAVAIANDSKFGLGASLWTESPAEAERWIPRIEAGAVFVNGMVKSDPRLPFGGVKTSGFGRELGLEGIRAFVNIKTVWVR